MSASSELSGKVPKTRHALREPLGWRYRVTRRIGPKSEAAAISLAAWCRGEIDWVHFERGLQRQLLDVLRETVGTAEVRNGMEQGRRWRRPDDCEPGSDEAWAARILSSASLRVAVEGLIDPALEWEGIFSSATRDLEQLKLAPEVTLGAAEMGRQRHACDALKLLDGVKFETVVASNQFDTEGDREWLESTIASIASSAFQAGRHYQAALNKALEGYAMKPSERARTGAAMTNAKRSKVYGTNATVQLNVWKY